VATRYALESLLDSDLQKYDWRLVVVDNGSSCPETVGLLQELEAQNERVRVEWLDANVGIGRGRNVGYRILQEWHGPELVVEMHVDHVFPRQWLEEIEAAMLRQTRWARVGIMSPALITQSVGWAAAQLPLNYTMPYDRFRGEVERCSMAVRWPKRVREGLAHPAVKRWAMLEEIGLYDDAMPGLQNFEDTEEAYRAWRAGWQMMIHFGSVVWHHYHYQRLGDEYGNAWSYNENYAYCQAKHGHEFVAFATGIMGRWMDAAYRRP